MKRKKQMMPIKSKICVYCQVLLLTLITTIISKCETYPSFCSLLFCDSYMRTVSLCRVEEVTHMHPHPPTPTHMPPRALIFVRVCDSPEVSTRPSNAERGEGDQVSLCHKKETEN